MNNLNTKHKLKLKFRQARAVNFRHIFLLVVKSFYLIGPFYRCLIGCCHQLTHYKDTNGEQLVISLRDDLECTIHAPGFADCKQSIVINHHKNEGVLGYTLVQQKVFLRLCFL
ncbi:hypothetical protein T09_12690 [Trichinella sp. T9]|nr:hypothetical protein T09_12690 [Trichinella sp. T9]